MTVGSMLMPEDRSRLTSCKQNKTVFLELVGKLEEYIMHQHTYMIVMV